VGQDKSNQSGRPVWIALVSALTAAGLAFCALAILIPPLFGAWAKPFVGAGELAGWTFLWAAAIMLVTAQAQVAPSFKTLAIDWLLLGLPAQFLLGFVFIALGYQGAFESAAFPFVAWLLAPGIAMIVIAFADDIVGKAKKEVDGNGGGFAEWPAIVRIVFGSLMMGLLILAIGIGIGSAYALYYALEAALIDGRALPLEAFAGVLWDAAKTGLSAALPGAIAVTFVWAGFTTIIEFAVPWVARLFGGTIEKPLTEAQIQVFEREVEKINAYGRAQGYDRYGWVQWAMLAVFFPLFLSFMLLPWYVFSEIVASDNAAREADHLWAISIREGAGVSTIILMFAGILLAMLPYYLAYLVFPRFAELSVWTGALTSGQNWWAGRLLVIVAKPKPHTDPVPDPGLFLREYARQICLYFIVPGLALAGIGAYFWRLDRADYSLLTPDHITTVNYWTGQQRVHRYEDVQFVTIKCAQDVSYGLTLRSGDWIGVEFGADQDARLTALTAIDERLRARGVKVEFSSRTPWFQDTVTDYSAECVADLAEGLPPERAAQIERILHLDNWRGRQ
jgi:hypothetical protein